jgi:hypothetical protein
MRSQPLLSGAQDKLIAEKYLIAEKELATKKDSRDDGNLPSRRATNLSG